MDFLVGVEDVTHDHKVDDLLLHFLLVLDADLVHSVELNNQAVIELFYMLIVGPQNFSQELELVPVNGLQCEATIGRVVEEGPRLSC